jgi:hypothetical protein
MTSSNDVLFPAPQGSQDVAVALGAVLGEVHVRSRQFDDACS